MADHELSKEEAKKEKIRSEFKKNRESISKEVYSNIELLANMKTLKEAQINLLSLRQRLLEDNHTLLEHLTILKRKMRKDRGVQLESLSKNLQLRYQANEKTVLIDSTTSDSKELMEIIENQIMFFKQTIEGVDSALFNIKTRIDIEKSFGL